MKTITTLAVTLLAGTALAQVREPATNEEVLTPSQQTVFASLDRNHDQRVSKTEAAADDGTARQFAALDANADGYIDQREYARIRQPRMPAPDRVPPGTDPQS